IATAILPPPLKVSAILQGGCVFFIKKQTKSNLFLYYIYYQLIFFSGIGVIFYAFLHFMQV
ncbi:MAG: hypothetical protein ABH871_08310, partial [Pseudomonadota bacterium]